MKNQKNGIVIMNNSQIFEEGDRVVYIRDGHIGQINKSELSTSEIDGAYYIEMIDLKNNRADIRRELSKYCKFVSLHRIKKM